jgi:hypothetical protein
VTGNVTGGNIVTAGLISATGNVSGSFFLGNGSQLSGISAAAASCPDRKRHIKYKFTGSGGCNHQHWWNSNVVVIDTTTLYCQRGQRSKHCEGQC